MRTTTRYCKVLSKTSKNEVMLRALNTEFHRKTSKEKVYLGAFEKKTEFPERKTHPNTSRKKVQQGSSKKRVRAGASHKKIYPSGKLDKSDENIWKGTREIWTVSGMGKENGSGQYVSPLSCAFDKPV